jgi:hypothetical protein
MYAGSVEMTMADRLALSPAEYSPVPVLFSIEDNQWVIYTRDSFYFHCECHDLVWQHNEMIAIDMGDGMPAFWRCPLPIDSAV